MKGMNSLPTISVFSFTKDRCPRTYLLRNTSANLVHRSFRFLHVLTYFLCLGTGLALVFRKSSDRTWKVVFPDYILFLFISLLSQSWHSPFNTKETTKVTLPQTWQWRSKHWLSALRQKQAAWSQRQAAWTPSLWGDWWLQVLFVLQNQVAGRRTESLHLKLKTIYWSQIIIHKTLLVVW